MDSPDQVPPDAPAHHEDVQLRAHASGQGKVYQAGRDQHFHYGDGARTRTEPGSVVSECPYPGLAPFTRERARWFFGRDRLTADLIDRLDRRQRTGGPQMIVASSGAGKSSLLRAGLLPRLENGALPGSAEWAKILFTPTARPVHALATHLAPLLAQPPSVEELVGNPQSCVTLLDDRLAGDNGLVLVVDQFEELFTLCGDVEQRRTFVELLSRIAAPRADGPALVVLGVRADFYAACADFPAIKTALQDAPLVVGAMTVEEVNEAIVFPAQNVGMDVEPGLLQLLLRDLGADGDGLGGYQAGRLPLLAHALRACWQQRNGATLTVRGYEVAGGIQHAIATTADRAYNSLDAAGKRMARSLFLRLTRIGNGTDDSRRRLSRTELIGTSADPGLAATVVDVFTKARLLTQHHDAVEITHEALLRSWPQLRRWIDRDRAGQLVQQELEEAATAWQREFRDSSRLYRGSRLAVANRWAARAAPDDLAPVVKAFLTASVAQERRTARRRTAMVVFLAVLSLLASTAAVVAVDQRNNVAARDRVNLARQLAAKAEALLTTRLDTAQLLAVAAYELDQNPQTKDALFQATTSSPHLSRYLYASSRVTALGSSADGRFLVTGAQDGNVQLWDLSTTAGQAIGRLSRPITDVGVDAIGNTVVFTDGAAVRLWRKETGTRNVPGPDGFRPTAVGVSPTHRYVVVGYSGSDTSAYPSRVVVHDESGNRSHTARSELDLSTRFGEIVFAGDDEAVIYNGLTAWERWSLPAVTIRSAAHGWVRVDTPSVTAISPKGRHFAAAWGETRVPIWRTNSAISNLSDGDLAGVTSGASPNALAISADGRRLAVADTGRIHVSTTSKNEPSNPEVLTGSSSINDMGLAFLGGGSDRLVSASGRTLAIWDLNQVTRLSQRMPIPLKWSCMACNGPALAVREGEDDVLVTSESGQTILAGVGSAPFRNRRIKGKYAHAAWSPDGKRLLLIKYSGEIEIRTPAPDWPTAGAWDTRQESILGAAWTSDGRGIVIVPDSGDIVLIDPGTGRVVRTVPHSADRQKNLSQEHGYSGPAHIDPQTMTVAIEDSTAGAIRDVLRVIDMATGRELLVRGDTMVGVAFAQGHLLIQRVTGDLEIRDARTTKLIRVLPENGHYVNGLWASRTGTVARLRSDGAVVLTDLNTGSDIGKIEAPQERREVRTGLAFLSRGRRLVAVTKPGPERSARLVVWEYGEDKMLQAACATVGRTLLPEERVLYIGANSLGRLPCTSPR
ncbi:AAA family ATPase [Nonomuraea sp. NPDC003709]|uniref:AAA family ATPase n=1 Tax=Nonomuraea sp. NPDC003709 TaxID=3154450 RepID=UPI0033B12C7F